MKHRTKILWLSSVVLLSGGAPSIQADRIDARTARSIATSFVSANSSKYKKVPTRMTDDPVYSPDVNGEPAMYVFNNPDNNGFTIVSGDDNLPTILGYSTEGSFDYDSIPENMKTLIDGYIKQISHYFNSGARKRVIVSYPVHSQINQLLKTTWNQDSPFNDMCPTSGGQHMPTGCSATATAQVMKFHQWPPKGNGVTLKGLDINNTEYHWDLMVDHYYGNESTASCEAVATLLYQIGSACDMAYDMSGSGAKDVYVQYALINNFNYNPGVKYILHDFMSDTEWDNAIYEELAAGRPVIMAGHGTKGGHCFVVDGYDGEGYYHINWGWGGYQDGFFMLNNLSPAAGGIGSFEGGYNLSQGALIEVFPAGHNDTAPQERIVSDTNMVINDSDRKICCSGDNAIFYNPTGRTISGSIVLCVERIDAVDNNVYSEVVRNFTNLAPLRGFWDFSLPTVSDVPDGNYKATLWLETKSGNRSQIISPYGMSDYVLVNIKNGKISSYKSENGSIQVGISSITGLDYAHAGEPLMITAKLTNFSNSDFSGKVSLKIYSKAEELVLTDSRKYTVKPESAEEVNFFTSRLPKTGEYLIRFETADGTISETIPFTVEAASDLSYGEKGLEVTYVSNTVYLDGVKTIAPNVIISNNLSQAQGFSPTAYLYDKDMKELTSASVGLYIPAKSESEANLSINYPNLSAGTYYISLRSSTYGNVSPYIPIRIFKYGQTDEVAYEVVSETDRKARIIAPASGYYSGSVVIPETVGDNYSVTEIDPTAIMGSSGVTEVTLPSSIRFIPGGTFVGTSIEELTIASQVPPVLGRGAFDMRGSMNTRLCIPDGTANTYARTSSWETFHIPSWTFTVEEGLNIGGLQNNPDVGKPFEPYYVSARETIEIEVSGADKIFADIAIANQELMLIEAENGKIKLPALGTADAKCRIVTDPSGINPVLSTGTEADIYNLQGIRVVKNADKASLPNLPAGVYIINGKKVQVK